MKKLNLFSIRITSLMLSSFFYLFITSCDERSNCKCDDADAAKKLALANENLAKAEEIITKWENLTTADFLEKAGDALRGVFLHSDTKSYYKRGFGIIEVKGGVLLSDFLVDFSKQIKLENPNNSGNYFDPNFFMLPNKITQAEVKSKNLSGIEPFIKKLKFKKNLKSDKKY